MNRFIKKSSIKLLSRFLIFLFATNITALGYNSYVPVVDSVNSDAIVTVQSVENRVELVSQGAGMGLPVVFIASTFIGLFFHNSSQATVCVWNNSGSGNWNTGTWTNGVPGSGDTAMFNGSSVSNCSITSDPNVKRIEITSAYSGTITQNSGVVINIGSGGFLQAGGAFSGGNSEFKITNGNFLLSGGIFTAPSADLTMSMNTIADTFMVTNGTFNHNNGRLNIYTFADGGITPSLTIDVNNRLTLGGLKWLANCNWDGGSRDGRFYISANDTLRIGKNLEYYGGGGFGGTGYYRWSYMIMMGGVLEMAGDTIRIGDNTYSTYGHGAGSTTLIKLTGAKKHYYSHKTGYLPALEISSNDTLEPSVGTTTLNLEKLSLSSGQFVAPTGQCLVRLSSGTIFSVSGGNFVHNNGTLAFGGYADGTLTGTIDVPSKLTLGSLLFAASGYQDNGNEHYTFQIASGDTLQLTGNLNIDRGNTGVTDLGLSGGVIEAQGNVTTTWCNSFTTSLLFSGSQSTQILSVNSPAVPSGSWVIDKSSGSVVLGASLALSGGMTILRGTFDQGTSYGFRTGGPLSLTSASAAWTNTGVGYDSLGGDVTNAGTITLDASTTACDLDSKIAIRSTNGTQRIWSGAGTFNMGDLTVKGMGTSGVTITANNSVDFGGNTGWTISNGCGEQTKHYWIASANGNFNTSSNWWPAFVPDSTDTAFFGYYSSANCAITADPNVKRLQMNSGYTGTITQNSGVSVTLGSGGFSQSGGTFSGGNSTIIVNGDYSVSGGTFTSTSNTLRVGDKAHTTFDISGGTFTHNNGTLKFYRKQAGNDTCFITIGASLGHRLSLGHLEIGATDNYSTFRYFVNIAGTDTLVVTRNYLQDGPNSGSSFVMGGVIGFAGDTIKVVPHAGGESQGYSSYSGGGTAKLLVYGNKPQYYQSTGGYLPCLEINSTDTLKAAGGVRNLGITAFVLTKGGFSAPLDTLTVMGWAGADIGDFIINGGTFVHNNGMVKLNHSQRLTHSSIISTSLSSNKITFGSLWFSTTSDGSGGVNTYTISSEDTLLVNGTFLAGAGSDNTRLNVNNGTIEVQGNVSFLSTNGANGSQGTASVVFTGTNQQILTYGGGMAMLSGSWEVKKPYNKVILGSHVTFPGALTVTSGVFSQGASYNLGVNGTLTIGTSGVLINKGTGSLTLGGNFINNGLINYNGYGHLGGDANISITASSACTWTGSGQFYLNDVQLTNQTNSTGSTIYPLSSGFTTCSGFDTTRNDTVRYSIGTNAATLYKTGSIIASPHSRILNFSGSTIPMTGTGAIGEGDRIILDTNGTSGGPDTCYVLSVNTGSQITLQKPPACSLYNEDFAFRRAFGGSSAMQNWEDARGNDLVTRKVVEKGICFADGVFSSSLTLSGATTGPSNFLWLTVAPGQRHNGTASGGGVVMDFGTQAINTIVDVTSDYTTLEWLRIKGPVQGLYAVSQLNLSGANNSVVSKCVLHDATYNGGSSVSLQGINSTNKNTNKIQNCVVYNFANTHAAGYTYGISGGILNGCTIYKMTGNTAYGTYGTNGGIRNCISMGSQKDFASGNTDYNVSSDTTAAGTHSFKSALASDQFVSISSGSEDLHIKYYSVARDAADSAGLSGNPLYNRDIDDTLRNGAALGKWDIGADEFIGMVPFTWTNAGGNNLWSNPANWYGGVKPGVNDVARFDNVTNQACNIDEDVSVKGMDILNTWSGTITQQSGRSLTIGSSGYSQAGGTFAGGNSSIQLNCGSFLLSGGTFTSTSGVLKMTNNADQTFTVSGTAVFNHNSGTIHFNGGTSGVVNNYTTTVDVPQRLELWNLILGHGASSGGWSYNLRKYVVAAGDTIRVNKELRIQREPVSLANWTTLTSGLIDLKGDSLVFDSSALRGKGQILISGSGTTYYRSSSSGSSGVLPKLVVNMAGTLTPAGASVLAASRFILKAGTFTAPAGNFFIDDSVTIADTGFQVYSGTTYNPNGGTLFLKTNTSYSSSNVSTLILDVPSKLNINNLTYGNGSGTWSTNIARYIIASGDTLTVNGSFRTASNQPALTRILSDGGVLEVKGDSAIFDSAAYSGTSTMLLHGGNLQHFKTQSTTVPVNYLVVNNPAGVKLASHAKLGKIRVEAGTFSQGFSNNLSTSDSLIIEAGTFIDTGIGDLTLGGPLYNNGSVVINGNGFGCGDNNDLIITSTNTTKRNWAGSGSFSIIDATIKYQKTANALIAYNSVDSTPATDSGFTLLLVCPGVTRTWTGASSPSWGDETNWSPVAVPSYLDTVVFDGTPGYDCYLNQPAQAKRMELRSGFTGTVQQGSDTLLIAGYGFSQAGGTFVGGSKKIDIRGGFSLSGGAFTSTADSLLLNNSGNLTVSGGSFNANSGMVAIKCKSTVSSGSASFNHFSVNTSDTVSVTGTLDVNGAFYNQSGVLRNGIATVAGNLVNNNTTAITSSATCFILDGGAAQSLSQVGGAIWGDSLVISKSSGSATQSSHFKVKKLIVNSGTFDQGSYGLRADSIAVSSGGTWRNVGSGYDSLGGVVRNNGSVVINSGAESCGDTRSIKIRSTSGAQRNWSGSGSFSIWDADIQNMTSSVPVNAHNSINSGGVIAQWRISRTCSPDNFLRFTKISIDTQAVSYYLDSVSQLSSDTTITLVYVYADTDSVHLANNFTTMTPWDTLTRVTAAASPISFGGLTAGRLYYFGVATQDTAGGWSTRINIARSWTIPKNPLHLAVAETPVLGDSGVVCTLSNISALPSTVDTVKFFNSLSGYQTNPQTGLGGGDTAFSKSQLTSDPLIFWRRGLNSATKYYFTVACGIKANPDEASRWAKIDPQSEVGNGDTLTTGNYASPPVPGISLTGIDTNSVRFDVTGPFLTSGTPNRIADSLYIYLVSGLDSANLANNYRSLAPWGKRDTLAPNCTGLEMTSLLNGYSYWLGVASRSSNQIWSQGISMVKVVTQMGNPVTIRLRRLDNSRVEVKYGGLSKLLSNVTTLRMWNRTGGYQTDTSSSVSADKNYPLPVAGDTLTDTLTYLSGTTARYYFTVSPGYTGNWAPISALNEAQIFIDNVNPVNGLSIGVSDSSSSSLTYNLSGSVPSDVQTISVYRDTVLSTLLSSFKIDGYAVDSFPKTNLINHVMSGLSELTRYYLGVSMRDTLGNWADNVVTLSQYTTLRNPLQVHVQESGTSGTLKLWFTGLDSLNAKVDTIRLFSRLVSSGFDEKTYGVDLKGSYSKAALLANDTVYLAGLSGRTKYYFAVSERAFAGYTHFGKITLANLDSITTLDYSEPANIGIAVTDSTYDSLKFVLNGASGLEADVKDVFLYVTTDITALRLNYKTMSSWDTLSRPEAISSGTFNVAGLAQGTKYYVAVALRDSTGNWSTVLNTDSVRTKLSNPIGLTGLWTPQQNQEVRLTLSGLSSISPKVTQIKLFYTRAPQLPILDPLHVAVPPNEAETTIVFSSFTGNPVVVTLPNNVNWFYHFSVSPGFVEDGKSWFGAITSANLDTVYVDAVEPPNDSMRLLQTDSSLTSLTLAVQGAYEVFGMDVETLFVWAAKANSPLDSSNLMSGFKLQAPFGFIDLDSVYFAFRPVVLTGLDTGSAYYVALAPRDSNGNYSLKSQVVQARTASRPLNPLTLAGTSPYWNTARLTIGNLNQLSSIVDRRRIRIYKSTTAYILNPLDTAGSQIFDLSTATGGSATVDVTGLAPRQLYYFSIGVMTTRGYASYIDDPLNVCQLTTRVADDTVAPNISGLTLAADSSKAFRPLVEVYYEVRGLNTISGVDRSTSVLRVYWSPLSPYRDFNNPGAGVGYRDTLLSTVPGDTLSWTLSGLLPGSLASGGGRPYYLSMSVRDSANNWDTVHIKLDTAFTRMDTGRPANDTGYSVDRMGFDRLVVNWRPTWFNNPSQSFRDTITQIGVWVRPDTLTQDTVDRRAPTFTFPVTAPTPQFAGVLSHNKRFHIGLSAQNTIGNWGRIADAKSYFKLVVPFDSATISRPPNVCSLWVKRTITADSLWVGFTARAIQYTDVNNGIPMPIKEVAVYYNKGLIPPDSAGRGLLVPGGLFTIDQSKLSDSVKMALPDSLLNGSISLAGFVINSLSSDYSNRYSGGTADARLTVSVPRAPVNNLVLDSLLAIGGGNVPPKFVTVWHIDTAKGPLPTDARFLYRIYVDSVPRRPDAPGYKVRTVPVGLGIRRDTLPEDLTYNRRWIAAGFVTTGSGVWSDSSNLAWDTLTTPASYDTIRPAKLPYELTATMLDCRTVRLSFSVDTMLLRQSQEAENNTLRLVLGESRTGSGKYLSPTEANPFGPEGILGYCVASHDTVLTNLDPNSDYYFAVSTIDTAGNAAAADVKSVGFIRTTVPSAPDSLFSLSMESNTSFMLDWSKGMASDSTSWNLDKNVSYVTVVLNNRGYYTGALPLLNGSGDGYFLCTTRPVNERRYLFTKAVDFPTKDMDKDTFYVTIFMTVSDHFYPAPLVQAGALHYKLDNSWLDSLRMVQVSDSLVRVTFIPRDSTERRIKISTMYHVNQGAEKALPVKAVDVVRSGGVVLTQDTLNRDVACTSYVRLSGLDLTDYQALKGSDAGTLHLRLLLSDMMPASKIREDTALSISSRIDAKPPTYLRDSLWYDRLNQHVYAWVKDDTTGDLARVEWGVRKDSLVRNLSYTTGSKLSFDSTGFNMIHVRYRDSLGNFRDTLWHDFDVVAIRMDSLYEKTTYYDNGRLRIWMPVGSISGEAFNYATIQVGLHPQPVDIAGLSAQGYSKVDPAKYWFLTQVPVSLSGTEPLYKNGIDVGIHFSVFDSSLRVYRLYDGNKLEYLGGVPDSASGLVWLRGFKPSDYWNSADQPGGASPEDTFTFVIARDDTLPAIDTVLAGITWNSNTAKVHLKVKDNNVYLDAGIKLYTFIRNTDAPIVIWDTVTTRLTSGTRAGVTQALADTVSCEYDFSAELNSRLSTVKFNGLYCAIYVSDGRKRFLYQSYPVPLDSVYGIFNTVTDPNWKIVSITTELEGSNRDMLSSLSNFQGIYDPARIRLYRITDNRFVEYSAGDTSFEIRPGRGYFMVTRYRSDDNVSFKTGACHTPSLKNTHGFALTNGTSDTGWQLLSLPFMGNVSITSLTNNSELLTTPGHVPLAQRLWRYNSFAEGWKLIGANGKISSSEGYGEGFLAYLYPGERLIAPLLSEAAYIPAKPLAKENEVGENDWTLSLSVGEGNGTFNSPLTLDRFGVSTSMYGNMADLMMPGNNVVSGFREGNSLLGYCLKKNDGKGKIWKAWMENRDLSAKDLTLKVSELTALPDGLYIYLDNRTSGYSTDLRATGGAYPFYAESRTPVSFNLVVGDSGFVMSHVGPSAPGSFALLPNFPNPFNPVTTIKYQVPDFMGGKGISKTRITLDVFNVRGQRVARILSGAATPGYHQLPWAGCDEVGRAVASGVYFYRITVMDAKGKVRFVNTRKMILLK